MPGDMTLKKNLELLIVDCVENKPAVVLSLGQTGNKDVRKTPYMQHVALAF